MSKMEQQGVTWQNDEDLRWNAVVLVDGICVWGDEDHYSPVEAWSRWFAEIPSDAKILVAAPQNADKRQQYDSLLYDYYERERLSMKQQCLDAAKHAEELDRRDEEYLRGSTNV